MVKHVLLQLRRAELIGTFYTILTRKGHLHALSTTQLQHDTITVQVSIGQYCKNLGKKEQGDYPDH